MGNWNSRGGVWKPAHERAVLPDAPPGEEIYEGPDRDATIMLKAAGVDHLGQPARLDPEMVMRARQLGFNSVDEYLSMYNYDEKKAEEGWKRDEERTVTHKKDPAKPPVRVPSGGDDTTGGGQSMKGGFGDPPKVA